MCGQFPGIGVKAAAPGGGFELNLRLPLLPLFWTKSPFRGRRAFRGAGRNRTPRASYGTSLIKGSNAPAPRRHQEGKQDCRRPMACRAEDPPRKGGGSDMRLEKPSSGMNLQGKHADADAKKFF